MAGKRYVSQYKALTVWLQDAYSEPTNAGMKLIRPGVAAFFTSEAGLRPEEERQAIEQMNIRGLVLDEAEIPEHPRYRLSVWDSSLAQQEHGWSDQERERFEGLLEGTPGFGQDFVLAEQAVLEPPWPSYDRTSAKGKRTTPETIVAMTHETGCDPEYVAAYERANKNRPEVLAALEALVAPPEPAEPVIEVSA